MTIEQYNDKLSFGLIKINNSRIDYGFYKEKDNSRIGDDP